MLPEHIAELLARLRDAGDNPLNDTELAELLTGLRSAAHGIRDGAETGLSDGDVEALRDIATAVTEVTTEQGTRAEAATAREAAADEALAAIGTDPDPDAVVDEVVEPDAPVEPTGEVTDPAAAAAEPAPAAPGDPAAPAAPVAVDPPAPAVEPVAEPIAASATPAPRRPTPGQAARRVAPALTPSRRPADRVASPSSAKATLVAAGGPTDMPPGSTFEGVNDMAPAILNAYRRMGANGRAMIASLITEYPEERHLRLGQDQQNAEKIDAALTEALVASGGICGPVAVDYTLPNWAVQDRPIKAGLPSFQADRGGLTFVRPQALTAWSDATEVWAESTDASPGTAAKPVHVMVCGDTDTVYVDAIPTRLRTGNMQGRYFPEQVAYNTTQALAQAARDAETNLWDKIIAASTIAHAPQYLGATRDLLSTIELAVGGLRDRGRWSDGQRVRMVIHRTFRAMLKADLAREIGHQQGEVNSLAITDAQIDEWLDAHGVTPIWAIDSPTPTTLHSVAIVAQGFGTQGAGSVVADWPASCAFTLFPEGGYQFLDGGRLDLGIVRDSVLDATNDYETFVEPFESVAFRAVEATTVVVPIVPNGGSAGTVAPAEPTE